LLEIELHLLGRAWEIRRDRAIAAEIELAMVRTQMRFVVGTAAVLIIASVTDRHHRPPSVGFSQNNKEMIFRVARQSSRTSENQKRSVGSNLRIDIERGAVAERKWLSLLIGVIRVLGREQTLPTLLVDGDKVDRSVSSNAWLPYRLAGKIDRT
jgi:hypothetical protein